MLTCSIKPEIRNRAVKGKECTKECDARAKLLFCWSKPIAFLAVLVAVEVVVALTPCYSCRTQLISVFDLPLCQWSGSVLDLPAPSWADRINLPNLPISLRMLSHCTLFSARCVINIHVHPY